MGGKERLKKGEEEVMWPAREGKMEIVGGWVRGGNGILPQDFAGALLD